MDYKFNGVILTEETLKKTDKFFADSAQGLINDVESGALRVNDEVKYLHDKKQEVKDCLAGRCRQSFTYFQRAYFIQTGKDVAFLPKG